MTFIIVLITATIKYTFYITIWYAALCIIKDYHKRNKEEKLPKIIEKQLEEKP